MPLKRLHILKKWHISKLQNSKSIIMRCQDWIKCTSLTIMIIISQITVIQNSCLHLYLFIIRTIFTSTQITALKQVPSMVFLLIQYYSMKHSVLSQIVKLLIISPCSALNVRMVKTQRPNVAIAQLNSSLIQLLSNANAVLVTGILLEI